MTTHSPADGEATDQNPGDAKLAIITGRLSIEIPR
jgi:hypothetical protein